MRLRRASTWAVTVAGVAIVVGLGLYFGSQKGPAEAARGSAPKNGPAALAAAVRPSPIPPRRADLDGQPALAAPLPAELSATECPPLFARLGAAGTTEQAEPGIVLDVLNAYRRLLGAYPAGEGNREIVNALLGANKERLPFIARDHPRLNTDGEIVDAWGTPFFFHMNSRQSVEVRSAGADRRMYTADDVVAGAPAPIHGAFTLPEDGLTSN